MGDNDLIDYTGTIMNFCTEAIQDLLCLRTRLALAGHAHDSQVCKQLMLSLTNAKKFLLPPPDQLNVTVTQPALKFMRLPYPICAFEYSTLQSGRKQIALAFDCRVNTPIVATMKASKSIPADAEGMLVCSLLYSPDVIQQWVPSIGIAYIDEVIAAAGVQEMLCTNDRTRTRAHVQMMFPDLGSTMYQDMSHTELGTSLMDAVTGALATTLRATLMLNAKNVKPVQVVKEPVALNRSRTKKHKVPFFEYYTLDVLVSQGKRLVDRKKVDFGAVRNTFGQMRNHYRWGTVMGHFKTRSTGIFWWSAHGRGDKDVGIITKDYNIKPN